MRIDKPEEGEAKKNKITFLNFMTYAGVQRITVGLGLG